MRTVQRLRLWTGVQVFLLIVVGTLTVSQLVRIGHLARHTHNSLCAFYIDLKDRADGTRTYLAQHPGKYPIQGLQITRAEIQRQLRSQDATLRSLSGLGCPTATSERKHS